MDLNMLLTHEGAMYLREWADIIPRAVGDVEESTLKVISVYQSVADKVGPHRESFLQMLLCIKNAQDQFVYVIDALPQMLRMTAIKIDFYVDSTCDSNPPPPVKKLSLHR